MTPRRALEPDQPAQPGLAEPGRAVEAITAELAAEVTAQPADAVRAASKLPDMLSAADVADRYGCDVRTARTIIRQAGAHAAARRLHVRVDMLDQLGTPLERGPHRPAGPAGARPPSSPTSTGGRPR